MARQKNAEPEAALFSAMALFWKNGFHNSSTRQIEQQTGITRFTLQTSYGSKMELFLKALDLYLDTFEEHVSPNMTDGAIETIADWFLARANPEHFAEIACFGCLMINSTVEFGSDNCAVNERADRFFTMVRTGFQTALAAAKSKGNLPADFDCTAHAQVLLAAAVGLNIKIRSATDNAAGLAMAQSTAALIRSWQTKH